VSDVKGPPADVTFTVTVTRKDTGKVESYQMEGYILSEPPIEATIPEGETQCLQP
jgi:hypothetical protein